MKDNSLHLVESYDDIVEEQWFITKELVNMDDVSLIEEAMYALEYYDCPGVEKIVRDYYLKQELDYSSIIAIEGFYRLVWSHFCFRGG